MHTPDLRSPLLIHTYMYACARLAKVPGARAATPARGDHAVALALERLELRERLVGGAGPDALVGAVRRLSAVGVDARHGHDCNAYKSTNTSERFT